ncbi:ATP-binding protein [uncultured Maribacter sp.]|uniref:ATP-binding protein n=1 Tax=uncultured Maribacter sp. TaxID=431308 RepID=UPI00262287FD|nr:ATP-binding protein [uncultured Maribacter sp.]
MKAKSLLTQISRLESSLSEFSFDELSSEEASKLKKSFSSFKKNLEDKIFSPLIPAYSEDDILPEKLEIKPLEVKENNTSSDATKLIANVSHEIRTPLNGIIGFADLLKESKLKGKQLEQVNAIQSASYSLMEIINELLEYSKLSAGLEEFESIDFNFHSLVKDVTYLCQTLIVNKEIKLNSSLDEAIPETLIGDPSKLSQILLNIMGNAIKFVEKGEINLEIELKELVNKKEYIIEFIIADTGIGMSQKQLSHIFDSFKQAEHDTFTKYGGTGLGLSIVKQIIEKLGGQIQVKSKEGVGTTFNFSLPYKEGDDSKVINKNKNTINLVKGKQLANGTRVLVFEDNLLNQKLIEQRLGSWNCKTYITEDAKEGLDILKNKKIDIVLMDLRMPEMNGFEVTEIIRSSKKKYINQVPIIALSADFSAKDEQLCKEHGINDFILKPYSPDDLLIKLVKNKNMKAVLTKEPKAFIEVQKDLSTKKEVDLSSIWEECMGQIELLDELIRLYKQNALEFIGVVKVHLINNSFEEVALAAHKIKAGLAMLKTDSLYEIIVQMQNSCKNNVDKKHVEFLYGRFLIEYPKVEKDIDVALEKFRNQ